MQSKKNNNKNKTTKHTIEFSNNTFRPRNKPAANSRLLVVRTAKDPPKWNFPLGHRRARRTGPCRDDSIKLRERKRRVKHPARRRI